MKCRNCGAELNNGKCEYCGSFFAEYQEYVRVRPDKDDDSRMHKVEMMLNVDIDPKLMVDIVTRHIERGRKYCTMN